MQHQQTNVVGYFNANNWPVSFSSSALGLSITVQPRKYLTDRDGNKINDPRLEQYCRPQMLSKEVTKTGETVPLRMIAGGTAATVAPATSPLSGFSASVDVPPLAANRAPTALKPPAKVQQPSTNLNPVMGMTMEEARKRGLVRATTTPPTGPKDDATTATSAAGAPYIEVARDVGPKGPAKPVLPPDAGPIAKELAAAAAVSPDSPDSSTGLKTILAPAIEAVAESAPRDHSKPVIGVPGQTGKPYVCNIDGKGFDYRSQLKKYAARKYPHILDQIMSPYPEQRAPQSAAAGLTPPPSIESATPAPAPAPEPSTTPAIESVLSDSELPSPTPLAGIDPPKV